MVIKIDYKDGKFSWQIADTETALVQNNQSELGVAMKGEAISEVEAMKLGTASIQELKRRREMQKSYPRVIEIL